MSGPDDGRPPDDDPFAFAPDERDAPDRPDGPESSDGPDRPGERDAGGPPPGDPQDDPFAFAPDERDAQPGRAEGAGADGETNTDDTDARSQDTAARSRAAAARERADEEAAARRTLLGAEASRSARAATTRWLVVGVLLLLVLAVGSTVLAGRGGDDAQVRPGERLPAFAAPIATRPQLKNDYVNLAQRDDQGQAGRRAACSIRETSAVTSCELLRRGPLVLVVFSRGVDACLRAVDDVERVRRALPGLTALAVATNGKHAETAETAVARRWGLLTAYDVDGALASRLGAAVCPLVLFVRRDGSVADRLVGDVEEAAIRVRARRLLDEPAGGPTTGPTAPAADATTGAATPPAATTTGTAAPSGR